MSESKGTPAEGLVSVIVPVYDVEDLLPRCVDSVLGQTYPCFELILVDDGSPDRSGEICDDYAAADSRIRCVHQANGGLSAARNAGVDIAAGEFLTFIDSDDWVDPDYLAELMKLLRSEDADIAVGGLLRTGAGPDDPLDGGLTKPLTLSGHEALTALYGELRVLLTVACGKIFRTELFTDLRFPVGRLHEDIYSSCRLLHCARRVVLTPESRYFYWQRPDSIMGAARGGSWRSLSDSIENYLDNAAFLGEVGFSDIQIRALRMATDYYADLVKFHSVTSPADSAEWNEQAAERLRKSVQQGLASCPGHYWARALLFVKLRFPRTVGSLAARIRGWGLHHGYGGRT